MPFYNLTEFLKLSAVLNYQISARQINWNNIISILSNDRHFSPKDNAILLQVLKYVSDVYGQKKRRLGSLAILHPLRTTVLLSSVLHNPTLVDYMTSLLHDLFEDIKPGKFKSSNWIKRDKEFQIFVKKIPPDDQWYLMERLNWLTHGPEETYFAYIGRLLLQAHNTPEVIRIKLADRLDNTLDMRIDLEDPLQGVDFFESIFQIFFTNTYQGYKPNTPHMPSETLDGAQRLYQLYKNVVLMSLIRQKYPLSRDDIAREIFNHLARASMREAQRVVLHIFGYHETDVSRLREFMIETMAYVQKGGVNAVTAPDKTNRLDGLFVSVFNDPARKTRRQKLALLYQDKPRMIEAALAFIVIFMDFINDDKYFVHGISEKGIFPDEDN
jgi:hypothetical protein